MITQEQLKNILRYDPETGDFYWIKPINGVKPFSKAGHMVHKYLCICINKRKYRAHRLAWLYTNGEWPENDIDHVNGNPVDNRIDNLREATRSQNNYNTKIRTDNNSGHKNVSWHKQRNKWTVRFRIDGKYKSYGLYDCLELASLVASELRAKYHGVFEMEASRAV